MASKAVTQVVKLIVPAGKASPSPPVGPALGARAVKAIDFCKELSKTADKDATNGHLMSLGDCPSFENGFLDNNARTAHFKPELPLPTLITINPDRTFSFTFRTPPVSYLLKKAAGIEKGSAAPGSAVAGTVTLKHVYEIAKIKASEDGMKHLGEERIARAVVGSAKSMGIEVVP